MDFSKITDKIDHQHKTQIKRKADAGQLRALELRWRIFVEEKYKVRVPDFIGRDRENLRHLWKEFGPLLTLTMEKAILQWGIMRQEKYLNRLSPSPIFREFFTYRAQIVAHLESRKLKDEQQSRYLKNLKEIEKNVSTRKIDFVKMVEDAKRKMKDERKTTNDPTDE